MFPSYRESALAAGVLVEYMLNESLVVAFLSSVLMCLFKFFVIIYIFMIW